jgi:hypothetical protein
MDSDEAIAGWVVNERVGPEQTPGAIRYYLAAIPDSDAALKAVKREIGGKPDLSLGSPVTQSLLERRKIAPGEVIAIRTKRTRSQAETGRIARATHGRPHMSEA